MLGSGSTEKSHATSGNNRVINNDNTLLSWPVIPTFGIILSFYEQNVSQELDSYCFIPVACVPEYILAFKLTILFSVEVYNKTLNENNPSSHVLDKSCF